MESFGDILWILDGNLASWVALDGYDLFPVTIV